METKKTVKNVKTTTTEEVQWVIGPGGVRMTYTEWLEMRKSERN